MRGLHDPALKAERLRLRDEEQLSYGEIHLRTGASKSLLSAWLKGHPLTPDARERKIRRTGRPRPRKTTGDKSRAYALHEGKAMTAAHKGKIAEMAIAKRLVDHGFDVYRSIFDGARIDFIVERQSDGRHFKIQARWAKCHKQGLPYLSTKRYDGHRSRRCYMRRGLDFLVGYDLFSDQAYVFAYDEVKGYRQAISVRQDAAERWDKTLHSS